MNKITEKITQQALGLLAKARDYKTIPEASTAFMEAENFIGCMAYLTGEVSNLEQLYRIQIVQGLDDGKSNAESEARAKASDQYKEWQKIKNLYELLGEQIKIIKKFQGRLDDEYESS